MIRPANPSDAQAICDIYNYYVLNTVITFEEEPVKLVEMEGRIRDISAKYPWLVYEEDGKVIGYTYASSWKPRSAYRHASEVAIYLENGKGGKGIGRKLYEALFIEIEKTAIHAVIGGVALPNAASEALHLNLGFEHIAHFREVGYKFGKWVDVVYFERIIKR